MKIALLAIALAVLSVGCQKKTLSPFYDESVLVDAHSLWEHQPATMTISSGQLRRPLSVTVETKTKGITVSCAGVNGFQVWRAEDGTFWCEEAKKW